MTAATVSDEQSPEEHEYQYVEVTNIQMHTKPQGQYKKWKCSGIFTGDVSPPYMSAYLRWFEPFFSTSKNPLRRCIASCYVRFLAASLRNKHLSIRAMFCQCSLMQFATFLQLSVFKPAFFLIGQA